MTLSSTASVKRSPRQASSLPTCQA